jgi:hypothetical protein
MLRWLIAAVMVGMFAVPVSAQEDQSANALKQCVADNTSGKDRKELAKWIFLAMAAHPDIKQYANAGPTAVDDSSRTIANLVTRLLTESCVNETRAVVQGGVGSRSFQLAFEGLGQLAMRELMADQSVQASMSVFQRYIDQKRFNDAFAPK